MRILETFLQGKEDFSLFCEDGLFVTEKLIAVVDGATSDGTDRWDGHKSGYFAKKVLLRCMEEIVQGEPVSSEDILGKLDKSLEDAVSAFKRSLEPWQYPKASVIFYNPAEGEIVSYGDCQCSINGVVHSDEKRIDKLNKELRAFVLEYELLKGRAVKELLMNDPGRIAITENLQKQCAFENVTGRFGYPVVNGRGIEPSLIKRYKVAPGDEVILASDGYPMLISDLEESEEFLCYKLREDPLCFREIPSTKGVKHGNVSFDDRAFCRFIV